MAKRGDYPYGRGRFRGRGRGGGQHPSGMPTGLVSDPSVRWDFSSEEVCLDETVTWLKSCEEPVPDFNVLLTWLKTDKKQTSTDANSAVVGHLYQEKTQTDVNTEKSKLADYHLWGLKIAKERANPFEAVRRAFFLNRSAMKMANMDAVLDFMFTTPKDNKQHSLVGEDEPLYFADICAGPGGFSEYVLWRRNADAKGFGITMKGREDFQLNNFLAGPREMFEPHYGEDGDGDVCSVANLNSFQEFVLKNTEGRKVHFAMADGAFTIDKKVEKQELVYKRVLLCQYLCALMTIRQGGHFVCNFFDTFTLFSAGLIYLMYRAFQEIAIFKPVTSRPANSERFIICKGLRSDAYHIEKYLNEVNLELDRLWNTLDRDINQIVPVELMINDGDFCQYLCDMTDNLGQKQVMALKKCQAFYKNHDLVESRKGELKKHCLNIWQIPDIERDSLICHWTTAERFARLTKTKETELVIEPLSLTSESMKNIKSIHDYSCVLRGAEKCWILISSGNSSVFKWEGGARQSCEYLNEIRVQLPRDTIIKAEIVEERAGNRQKKALHIIDAMFLSGKDVSTMHFSERMKRLRIFVKCLAQSTRSGIAPIRVKDVYNFEDIQQMFELFKSDDSISFRPTGIHFMKIIKDPWIMAWNQSENKKYFYHTLSGKSVFEMPDESVASFADSWKHHMFWQCEDLVTKSAIVEFECKRRYLDGEKLMQL